MLKLSVSYLDPEYLEDSKILWKGRIRLDDNRDFVLNFEFTCPDKAHFKPTVRPFVLAALLPAMRHGVPLEFEGQLDQEAFRNLSELQDHLCNWIPNLQKVAIVGQIAPEDFGFKNRHQAISTFSGGVDSCHTAISYNELLGDQSSPLKAGLMVHGFDIPLRDTAIFETAFARSEKILHAFEFEAYQLRTNIRGLEKMFGIEWAAEAHGVFLGAAISCYESFFDVALIPSTYPSYHLVFPWGSNPISDPLYSSSSMSVIHCGSAHDKLAKVTKISESESIKQNLRVCWEGAKGDRNCGTCFKCLATQACFWTIGHRDVPAFETPAHPQLLEKIPIKNTVNHVLIQKIRDKARSNNQHDVADALEVALKQKRSEKVISTAKKIAKLLLGRS